MARYNSSSATGLHQTSRNTRPSQNPAAFQINKIKVPSKHLGEASTPTRPASTIADPQFGRNQSHGNTATTAVTLSAVPLLMASLTSALAGSASAFPPPTRPFASAFAQLGALPAELGALLWAASAISTASMPVMTSQRPSGKVYTSKGEGEGVKGLGQVVSFLGCFRAQRKGKGPKGARAWLIVCTIRQLNLSPKTTEATLSDSRLQQQVTRRALEQQW